MAESGNYTYKYPELEMFFLEISPYIWANLGAALAISLSVMAAAWGIALSGTTILGQAVATPRIRTKNIISIIFCEALAIYGIITAIIVQLKIKNTHVLHIGDYFSGYAIFWSGILVGFSNIACGIAVGVSGTSAAIADSANPELFIKVLVIEIFASALGLFGLIVGIIQANGASFGTDTTGII
uniref:V-ATPase proteolipid subunit C-like domain-containing protein n=1 Tax=Arcella intermedia TaxID=1963864 RepID=A0A6B2LK91_9EUKA|eukprot:TRINITY_DN6572_c0_g1_i1.p1 TRINITY_DN6572_c0_g1~~TRINITY_DN6572_c0_g1_i1.p1  ORF type:complete len:184 (-),score=25.46 TRINITY_DN6572_c0_g1_i1:80-631(-)